MAYQQFLIASRKEPGKESESRKHADETSVSPIGADQEPKEALFKRVDRKQEKKEIESEDLEVQDISVDDS